MTENGDTSIQYSVLTGLFATVGMDVLSATRAAWLPAHADRYRR